MQPFPSPFAYPPLPRTGFPPPPSSQPVRQRSRTVMPFAQGSPLPSQYAPRRVPAGPPSSSANEERQLNFPYAPPQRPPSSRPSSAFAPSQLPLSQVDRQGREPSFPRPESSYGESGSDHRALEHHPMSASQAVVDRYQPPGPGNSDGTSRGGAQVYQTARAPKPQKAQEILTNLDGLREWLEQTFRDRDDNEKAEREAMSDRLKALEKDNRDIKEAIHELGMGQKVLPTKAELGEELTNQLAPALETCFDSFHHTLRTTIEPLSNDITKQTAEKIKLSMLELQDTAKREALQHGAIETPLASLMRHLVQALGPLQNITKTLESLSSLPEALHNVAIFQQTMDEMKEKIAARPQHSSATTVAETSPLAALIKDLTLKVDEIKLRFGSFSASGTSTSAGTSSESSQLTNAIQTLADRLGDRISSGVTSRAFEVSAPIPTQTVRRESTSAADRTGPSPGDLSPDHRPTALTPMVPLVNLVPPSSEPPFESPASIAKGNEAIEAAKWDRSSLTVREEARYRSPTISTPSALKGVLIGGDDDGDDEGTPPANRGSLFTASALAINSNSSAASVGYNAEKRKRIPTPQVTFAQAIADSSVAANQAITTPIPAQGALQSDSIPVQTKRLPTDNPSTIFETLPQALSQNNENEPEYVSSGSNPPKRRKSSSVTRAIKQEKLSGHLLGYKPTTRSEATRAKEVGIDIINLVDSQSSGSRTNSSEGRKSRTKSQQGRWHKSKETEAQASQKSSSFEYELLSLAEPQATTRDDDVQQTHQDTYTFASQADNTQTGLSRLGSSAHLEFGYGQALSVPSIPGPSSTNFTFETEEPTLGSCPDYRESPPAGQKQSTSTDRVEASPSLAVVSPRGHHQQSTPEPSPKTPSQPSLPPPPRSVPPTQRYYGKAAHDRKLNNFVRSFAAMDSDED